MTTRKLMIISTLILALAFLGGNASAKVFRVDLTGDPDTTYVSLASALSTAATFGGTDHVIEIEDGTYITDHTLTAPTNVAEIIAVGDAVVFQCPAGMYQTVDFLDVSGTTGLTISGFMVMDYKSALTGTGVDGLTVTGMVFDNNGVDGYVTAPDEDGGAVIMYDCDDGWFEDLEIMNGERGIRLRTASGPDYSDGNTIKGCLIYDNEQYGIGIGWDGGSNNTIEGNTVYGSEDFGIQVRGAAGSGNDIIGNTVYDCLWEGITVSGCTGSLIQDNEVYDCAYQITNPSGANDWTGLTYSGINVEGAATSATIAGNVCYNNGDGVTGFGLYVQGYYCDVSDNCLHGHPGAQAYDNQAGPNNYWHGNYYGAYVSIPHAIGPGGAQDYSPKVYDNSAYASTTDWEIFQDLEETYVVDFKWTIPNCDPWDTLGLASYNFSVHYDDTKLELVDYGYHYEFLGADDGLSGAVYGPPLVDADSITFSAANYVNLGYGDGDFAWAEFKVLDVGATDITISSLYQDSLNNAITTGNTPLSLTLVDTQDPELVSVTGPSVVSDAAAACFDASLQVLLEVEAAATDNFDLRRIRYKFDDGGAATLIGGLGGTTGGTTTPVTLNTTGLTEDTHTLKVWAEDQAGNESDTTEHTFDVDRTGPVLDAIVLSDLDDCAIDPEYTDNSEVQVDLTNTDGTAVKMKWSIGSGFDLPNGSGPLDYAASFAFDFGGDGSRTLHVKLYDAYGNCGAYISDAITVDEDAPQMTGPLSINDGAAKTNDVNVVVRPAVWNTAGGAEEYDLSDDENDLVCGDDGWANILAIGSPYKAPYELSTVEGDQTVYCAVRDLAGNISDVLSATIEYDITAPELLTFDIDGDCVGNRNVTINFTWDGADDANYILIGEATGVYDSTIDISAMDPAGATVGFKLSDGDGPYTLYAILEDDIGNQSTTEMSDATILDRSDPVVTSVVVRDLDYPATDPPIHANYSNSATVNLEIGGLSADVVALVISETGAFAGEEVEYAVTGPFDDPFIFQYDHTAAVDCATGMVYVEVKDCAGNVTGSPVSDGIVFDMTNGPTVNDFSGPTLTNTLAVTLAVDASDDCTNPYRMKIYEDGYGPGSWVNYGTSYALTLEDDGDGDRTVHMSVSDRAGNITDATPIIITVDQTVPTGTIGIVSTNPISAPGYTNVWTVDLSFTYDGDVDSMWIGDAGGNTGTIPVAATYAWTLGGPPSYGLNTVTVYFQDGAGNWSAAIPGSIFLDQVSPSAAGMVATGLPGGSCKLSWTDPTEGAMWMYYIRYNETDDYPLYASSPPPHPASMIDGHEVDDWFYGNEYDFDGPQMDIYAFSIWVMDSAGNMSTDFNSDVVSTNYILGDFDDNDTVSFLDDIGQLASCYGEPPSVTTFEHCDVGPTHNGQRTGLPVPDDMVNYEDLFIVAMNYAIHGDWMSKMGETGGFDFDQLDHPKVNPASAVVAAEVPDRLCEGEEYVISITTDNPEAFMGFHLVFGFNDEHVSVADVRKGNMLDTDANTFFFDRAEGSTVMIDGVILGPDPKFENNEFAQIVFVANTDCSNFEIEALELTLRDMQNQDLDATFELTTKYMTVLPTEFALSQNYPNPFNPVTTINMSLPIACDYTLEILNIVGQRVESFSGHSDAGIITINWDAKNLSSGIYFYRMKAENFTATRKMVLLK